MSPVERPTWVAEKKYGKRWVVVLHTPDGKVGRPRFAGDDEDAAVKQAAKFNAESPL